MNEVKEMVEELRNKKSRDNRDLLDRSADMIEKLAKEPCKKSPCHHIMGDMLFGFVFNDNWGCYNP